MQLPFQNWSLQAWAVLWGMSLGREGHSGVFQAQDPREFQINQLRRRYRPQEVNDAQGTTLTFGLVPSSKSQSSTLSIIDFLWTVTPPQLVDLELSWI
jgi:hypothetical protein